jgi:Heme/copper-type cytochrome/quinol oxidases, subunit 2
MALISRSFEDWYKKFSKEEKIWIITAFIVAIILATTTVTWHIFDSKHQVPSYSKEIDPYVFKEMAINFSREYNNKFIPPNVDIYIAAQQYYWSVQKIILKKNTDYRFYVASLDVIHGFTIVGNGVVYNLMVMPGMTYGFTINFNKEGKYYVICSEYCGYGHGEMRMIIEVIT